jgi:hypothetical protein
VTVGRPVDVGVDPSSGSHGCCENSSKLSP